MTEKNEEGRFGYLAEKYIAEMTEEELRQFPEKWLIRYGELKKQQEDLLQKIDDEDLKKETLSENNKTL